LLPGRTGDILKGRADQIYKAGSHCPINISRHKTNYKALEIMI
jgi:hypothetical protein